MKALHSISKQLDGNPHKAKEIKEIMLIYKGTVLGIRVYRRGRIDRGGMSRLPKSNVWKNIRICLIQEIYDYMILIKFLFNSYIKNPFDNDLKYLNLLEIIHKNGNNLLSTLKSI
jgi:hypothetical protein